MFESINRSGLRIESPKFDRYIVCSNREPLLNGAVLLNTALGIE
jgi:hypothetical protein